MSERIDFLIPWVPADNSLPFFVVNKAVPYVPIQAGAGSNVLYNGNKGSIFAKGDSFTILSAGLIMPLAFQIERSLNPTYYPYVGMSLLGAGNTSHVLYYFRELYAGAAALFYLPAENYDTPFDIFIDLPNEPPTAGNYIINEKFQLFITLNEPDHAVNMAGVPSALDGTTQFMTPYVKISHNHPMTI